MFIIDSTNRLIAAEPADLAQWEVEDIYAAARAFRLGTLRLDRVQSRLTLPSGETFDCQIDPMESVLGPLAFCTMQVAEAEIWTETSTPEQTEEEETTAPSAEIPDEELLALLPLEEESATEEKEVAGEPVPPLPEEEESLEDEIEALLKISEEEEPEITLMSQEEELPVKEEEAGEESIPQISEPEASPEIGESKPVDESIPMITLPEAKVTPWEEIEAEFQPDLHANADRIELTDQEYADLLKDFIHDSRAMREQFLDPDGQKRRNATAVLKDAISLLHLSPLDRLLGMLEEASPDERREIVNEYDRLLGQLEVMLISLESEAAPTTETTTPPSPAVEEPKELKVAPPREEEAPTVEERPPAPGEPATTNEEIPTSEISITAEQETPAAVTKINVEDFLKGVKPIPIEFSLQIASQELNLPEDLVLEFINDFDKQGHEYLPVLIDAYQKKDLDHLQKTAHMLKGAASNLRIEAMVDNLYDLQFDNDIERAPQRIRLFAGQLMSLDNYLKQMNQ